MTVPRRLLFGTACLALAASSAPLNAATRAFVGARIIPLAGPEIAEGVLVVEDGKILAVGAVGQVELPATAEIVTLPQRVIMPGLVDTHSHIGQVSGGDSSAVLHPEVRVLDAINVRSTTLQKAQAGGITTVNIMPGSGHLLSGQTLYLKLRDGGTIEELLIHDRGGIAGGMKMANGTNSQRATPPFPETRAKSAALVRTELIKAREYQARRERFKDDLEKRPASDLRMEGLLRILDREWIVHHHTHRHDDIMTVLRLAGEFNLRVVLHHVSDGWKVADQIAAAGVPASIIVVDSPGGKLEARDLQLTCGAVLERAGVQVAFHTDDPITDSRLFLRSAALAVRAGMSRQKALEGLTLAAAAMLGLEHRVGSLAAGKDADFIVLSGDPLSVYTHVLETYVEGTRVFDRSDPRDLLYAVGGTGAGEEQAGHVHCWDGRSE